MHEHSTHGTHHPYGLVSQILTTISFLIGITGNIAALWILYKSARTRNRKHVLMLRWLSTNDLVAVVGMLTANYLKRYSVIPEFWSCVSFVVLRAFGLGSGCVAFIMALERWLALTRPFLYHKVVTYEVVKRTLCCLWFGALFLTCLPLFGFGLYFENGKCARFRYASLVKDKIYAYFFFFVGSTLCISIALCNIAVVCELSKIRTQNHILVRRISRSLIVNNRTASCPRHHQTPEEVAFAKLMAYICVMFLVCWGPQVITVPIAQFSAIPKSSPINILADIMLSVYFTLDPYIYVLQRNLRS
ncbi:cannabinoid receptor 1 isoform X3 [Cylas formicarius]|uniref:cannabinoid receptor 1 isoform X3 n=1 Tax=Cylas formicarius TaxID=197179 RepID=UPI00295863F9|nr:cannabinoid receptor 1 isoform X3 [Cylas formicarius]